MKKVFWMVIFFVVAYGLYWIWNSLDLAENKAIVNPFENPIVIVNPVISGFDKSNKNIKIVAKKAEIYQKQSITRLFEIEGEVFSQKEVGQSLRFKAKIGTLNQTNKTLILQKNVTIKLHDGKIISSDELTYNNLTGIVSTDTSVVVTDISGSKVRGSAMMYNIREVILQIKYPRMSLIID